MNKLIIATVLIFSVNCRADNSQMKSSVQEALIKQFKLDEVISSYEKDFQQKYIPDSYIKPAVVANFANNLLIKKQISLEWRF